MLGLVIILAIFGFVASSPTKIDDDRIVGGEIIDISEAPYQVALVLNGSFHCGGSIFNENVIVTAAHCIVTPDLKFYQIRVGSSFRLSGGTLHPVTKILTHPQYDTRKTNNDIALMWLSKPIQFGKNANPIKLIDAGKEIKEGENTIVTGWGTLTEGGPNPTKLQRVTVKIINQAYCKKAYPYLTPQMLCAGVPGGGKDSCQGDSGGPLVYNNQLAGVVSFGMGCAQPAFPGVYARVSVLRDWLESAIASYQVEDAKDICDTNVISDNKVIDVTEEIGSIQEIGDSTENIKEIGDTNDISDAKDIGMPRRLMTTGTDSTRDIGNIKNIRKITRPSPL